MAQKEVTGKNVAISKGFKDIDFGLRRNPFTGDIYDLKNTSAIKAALKNIMLTKRTEKLMVPDFGTNIYEALFEPMDDLTADRIRNEIINVLGQYETRISIRKVNVNQYPYENAYQISVTYRIVGTPMTERVSFILERPNY